MTQKKLTDVRILSHTKVLDHARTGVDSVRRSRQGRREAQVHALNQGGAELCRGSRRAGQKERVVALRPDAWREDRARAAQGPTAISLEPPADESAPAPRRILCRAFGARLTWILALF